MTEETAAKLGPTLKSLRDLQARSLKAVAELADISPAYLQKLERGDVTTPSPHVLHRLADALGTGYLDLMRAAGYVVPESVTKNTGALAHALSAQNLTEEEAQALTTYLKVFRSGRSD